MKSAWQRSTIGAVAEVIAGQSPEGAFYNTAGQGLPFYQGKKEFGERFVGPAEKWTSQVTKVAKPGDVLMSVRAPVGPVNIAQEECCIGRGLAAIRSLGRVEPAFLFYFLFSKEPEIRGTEGAVFASISRDDIRAIPIQLPLLAEQRRIVGILDEAFEGIAIARSNVERNLLNARSLFESHLEGVFGCRDPEWIERVIEDDIRFIDYRGRTPTKTPSGLRLITAKNVKMGYLQEEPREFVAPASYGDWMTRGIPRRGDVLFTTEAPLANVAQLDTDEKVVFAQRIIIMQPDASRLDSSFLKYMLLSKPMQQRIHVHGTGATVKGIKASLLKQIEISYPRSLVEQRAIVQRLDRLEQETQRLESVYERKLAALDELKRALLHQAFTGCLTERAAAHLVAV